MAAFDFKKDRKDLYMPSTAPAIVDVPEMLFMMVDGTGNPNDSEAFQGVMAALYGLTYTIRMNKAEVGYVATVVPPLEGFWDFKDPKQYIESGDMPGKDAFTWTLAIRQPEFVTPAVFAAAKVKLSKKKPELDLDPVRLERFAEGLCVQALHIGPYDSEPATIKAMERYQEQRGFRLNHSKIRRHHELYLSNPQTTAPEKLKTIIRLPIRRR